MKLRMLKDGDGVFAKRDVVLPDRFGKVLFYDVGTGHYFVTFHAIIGLKRSELRAPPRRKK